MVTELVDEQVIITDLKESFYAIAIYHDQNSNNKFDTFLSIPQEKFGFSNDAKKFFLDHQVLTRPILFEKKIKD